jgi:hypothetical protein
MILLRLGGGPRAGHARWPAEDFTTITRATYPTDDLLGDADEQEVFQPRPSVRPHTVRSHPGASTIARMCAACGWFTSAASSESIRKI